jgi:hypothetical protein
MAFRKFKEREALMGNGCGAAVSFLSPAIPSSNKMVSRSVTSDPLGKHK